MEKSFCEQGTKNITSLFSIHELGIIESLRRNKLLIYFKITLNKPVLWWVHESFTQGMFQHNM